MASDSVSLPEYPRARLRSGGLRRRLVLAFGSASAALILATLIPLGFILARSHLDQYADQNERLARAAAGAAAADPPTAASEIATRFPAGGSVLALLLDRRAQPRSLVLDPGAFPSVASRTEEVRAALRGQVIARAGSSESGPRLFVAAPIAGKDRVEGVVWLSAPIDPVDELDRRSWAALGTIGAAAILFSILVAVAVSRTIARRLETVAAGAERFAEGRFAEPIVVGGDDEVAQLGARLNEMARRIERAVARERDFAAAASHQLRTPLTAIKLRIEELRLLPGDHPTANEYLEEIGQEVDRLEFLASGLLVLAASEGGRMPFEALPARDAVEQAVERLRPLARQHGIEIAMGESADAAAVRTPRGAFEEVVFNLLDNAVKYSPPGGRVEVTASPSGQFLELTVGDRGAGISRDESEHVFEPFFRARRASGVRGSGLGLSICMRLCEVAGATIALAPRDGGGTLAVVRWPLADRDPG